MNRAFYDAPALRRRTALAFTVINPETMLEAALCAIDGGVIAQR